MFKSYYAILPAPVRYDEELCADEKLLVAEVSALMTNEEACTVSNGYFASLFNTDAATVEQWIEHLVSKNYLQMDIQDGVRILYWY